MFNQYIWSFTVDETNIVGRYVGRVIASDADGDTLTYGFEDPQRFSINPTTGEITTLYSIDADGSTTFYRFAVYVTDGVNTEYADVTVSVSDINDNPPRIDKSEYTVAVDETVALGTNLVSITATDADARSTNFRMTVEITGGDSLAQFAISTTAVTRTSTTVLSVAKALDFNVKTAYNITIRVFNPTVPLLEAFTVVRVTVRDVNNNAPEFFPADLPYVASTPENSANGTLVTTIRASDKDTGINALITFEFTSSASFPFTIDPNSGAIRVNGAINYETVTAYSLVVQASDRGVPVNKVSTSVTVNILDQNDNVPVFDPNGVYACTLSESVPVNTLCLRTMATDADATGNTITYTMTRGSILFGIHTIDWRDHHQGRAGSRDHKLLLPGNHRHR